MLEICVGVFRRCTNEKVTTAVKLLEHIKVFPSVVVQKLFSSRSIVEVCCTRDRAPSIDEVDPSLPKLNLETEGKCSAEHRMLFQQVERNLWDWVMIFTLGSGEKIDLNIVLLKLDQVFQTLVILLGPIYAEKLFVELEIGFNRSLDIAAGPIKVLVAFRYVNAKNMVGIEKDLRRHQDRECDHFGAHEWSQ